MRYIPKVAILCLLLTSSAWAQAPSDDPETEPQSQPTTPAEAVQEPDTATLTVEVLVADSEQNPPTEVLLRGVFQGAGVMSATDAPIVDGVGSFEVPNDDEGLVYLATVTVDEIVFNADSPMSLAGVRATEIEVLPRTSDPSSIGVTRLITLLQLFESYITVEQVWLLATTEPVIYVPEPDSDRGLVIHMPEGVEGIHVYEPAQGAMAGEDSVVLRTPVWPEGTRRREAAELIVQYSLPNESADYLFDQEIGMPVGEAVVILPQVIERLETPEIDVELTVPVCGQGAIAADAICFETLGGETPQWDPYRDRPRRAAQDGHSEHSSARLVFGTHGWPTPSSHMQTLAISGLILAFLLCFGLWRSRTRGGGEAAQQRRTQLENFSKRQVLLAALRDLERAYKGGQIPESEYELEGLLLAHKLERVYTTLGIDPPSIDVAPSEAGSP